MSTATPRRLPPGGARGHGPMAGMGMPAEKSMSFGPSARRLIGRTRPERARVLMVLVLAVVSVSLTVLGPRILGRATDIIFAGVIGGRMQLPPGTTKAAAVEGIRASGKSDLADMLARIDWAPGRGIDFAALGHVLLLALALYVAAAVFGWAQGYLLNDVVQRTVFRLRSDVEDKLNRLPLPYFDRQPRGELLSRVTNDIDNIAQSLQQTMSQLLTSLLTVVGVVLMMFLISPLLSLIALVTIPLSVLVTQQIAKRSQKLFVAQWTHTGALNGQVEEAYTGHELVKVFGRQQEVEARLRRQERGAVRRQLRRAVRQRHHHAGDDVHREPQLRRHRRRRRPARGVGHDEPGRRAGVHPVLPAVHPAADPGGVDGQPAAVRGRLGRAGLRPARRRRAGARRGRRRRWSATRTAGWRSSTSRSATGPRRR